MPLLLTTVRHIIAALQETALDPHVISFIVLLVIMVRGSNATAGNGLLCTAVFNSYTSFARQTLGLPYPYLLPLALCCSYRGYGQSEGSPSQPGIMQDAQAALDHVLGRADVNSSRIVVMGRSLGGAVAIHLAASNPDKVWQIT